MEHERQYAFGKSVADDFATVSQKVRDELQQEGFGILSEIDVTAKFAEKLDKTFRKYVILGACNPQLAWEAFGKELDIGTLLPCNVVVYENDAGGTTVMAMDPEAALALVDNAEVAGLAQQVKAKVSRALEKV